MMKIILVNTVCGQGSVGRITADLYEAVLRHGDMAQIAYGRGKAAEVIFLEAKQDSAPQPGRKNFWRF